MVYNETDINFLNFRYNLDNQTYLTESESSLFDDFNTIPVIENTRLGLHIVDYSNIERLLETTCYSVNEIISCIESVNNLDSLTVAVDDYKLILHPEIVNEMDNIVIKPLPKNDPAYIFTEACLDKFMETMDESYIDYLTTIHEEENPYKTLINDLENDDEAAEEFKKGYPDVYKFVSKMSNASDDELSSNFIRSHNYVNKNFIAKQIQRLHSWAKKMESKLDTPEKRGIWQKIKAAVFKAIQKLTKMLGADPNMSHAEVKFLNMAKDS